MATERCKHEWQGANATQEWEGSYRIRREDSGESALPDNQKMLALRGILFGEFRKQVEHRKVVLRYDDLIQGMRNYMGCCDRHRERQE